MPGLMKKHGTWHALLVEWSAVTNWYSVDKYEVRDFGGMPTCSVFWLRPACLGVTTGDVSNFLVVTETFAD